MAYHILVKQEFHLVDDAGHDVVEPTVSDGRYTFEQFIKKYNPLMDDIKIDDSDRDDPEKEVEVKSSVDMPTMPNLTTPLTQPTDEATDALSKALLNVPGEDLAKKLSAVKQEKKAVAKVHEPVKEPEVTQEVEKPEVEESVEKPTQESTPESTSQVEPTSDEEADALGLGDAPAEEYGTPLFASQSAPQDEPLF